MSGVTNNAATGVLAYLVAATFAEVFLFKTIGATGLAYAGIGVVAASKAVLIAAFFMELRYEPRPIRIITALAVAFLALMLVVLIFSFAHTIS